MRRSGSFVVLVAFLLGCEARIEAPLRDASNPGAGGGTNLGVGGASGAGGGMAAVLAPPTALVQGMRRLSRAELGASLSDLLGVPTSEVFTLMPEDEGAPFDNDYTKQTPSGALVDGADGVAAVLATRLLADPGRRNALVGCTPVKVDDAQCLTQFITRFGQKALRRPLAANEIADLLTTTVFAIRANDFYFAVELVIRSLVQDVEFLYRVEVGTAVSATPGVKRLGAYELASKLSFTLWGRTPPDWLLALAQQNRLSTPAEIRAAAQQLLDDPNAHAHLQRFHSLWLGYSFLPHAPALADAMKAETAALIEKVVFTDSNDYAQLFLSRQTWVTPALATHYGLPASPGTSPGWVSLTGTRRQGILAQGAILSNGAKQTDTSPTLRGKFIRERLFCQKIDPPPSIVNTDVPPMSTNGSACKKDRYAAHASVGSCSSCHRSMDPVGFGLENFDLAGKWRDEEAAHPECKIDGNGEIAGVGAFNGATGLAAMLVSSNQLEPCVVRQVFRFAAGREELSTDQAWLKHLEVDFKANGRKLQGLLLDLVASEAFASRTEEAVP